MSFVRILNDPDRVIYISGPMSGVEDFNYPYFEDVQSRLTVDGYTVLSPHEVDNSDVPVGEKSYGWYLSRAIEMQLQSNCWCGLPGWVDSKGAMREFNLARDLGHEMILFIENPKNQDYSLLHMRSRSLT